MDRSGLYAVVKSAAVVTNLESGIAAHKDSSLFLVLSRFVASLVKDVVELRVSDLIPGPLLQITVIAYVPVLIATPVLFDHRCVVLKNLLALLSYNSVVVDLLPPVGLAANLP